MNPPSNKKNSNMSPSDNEEKNKAPNPSSSSLHDDNKSPDDNAPSFHNISINSTPAAQTAPQHENIPSTTPQRTTKTNNYSATKYLSLKYQRTILQDLNITTPTKDPNSLVICDKGLGLQENILVAFLRHYATEKGQLVLVLNATSRQSDYILQEINEVAFLKKASSLASSVKDPSVNQVKARNVKSLTSSERRREYYSGGLIFISSNVLAADFLQSNLQIDLISGIVVMNAHEVTDLSYEAMVIRLFREQNQSGFVKALSDSPVGFLRVSAKSRRHTLGGDTGISKHIDKVMSLLCLNRVYLWPYYDERISKTVPGPNVDNVELTLTPSMKRIEENLLILLKKALEETKKEYKELDFGESVTHSVLLHLDYIIKSQLKPKWNHIKKVTKDRIEDIKELRRLLLNLTQYDCVTYHRHLQNIRTSIIGGGVRRGGWVLTKEADIIFECARQRVYVPKTVTKVKRQKTMTQMAAKEAKRTTSETQVKVKVEPLPKWTQLEVLLQEIGDLIINSAHLDNASNRVLIVTKSERVVSQLQSVLQRGPKDYLKQHAIRMARVSSSDTIKEYFPSKKTAQGQDDKTPTKNGGASANRKTDTSATKKTDTTPKQPKRGKKRKSPAAHAMGVETAQQLENIKSILESEVMAHNIPGIESLLDVFAPAITSYGQEQCNTEKEIEEFEQYFGLFDQPSSSKQASPDIDITIACTHDCLNILNLLRPTYIICYDHDLEFYRRIMVYDSENPGVPVKLYDMYYANSMEEESYMAYCESIRNAFQTLLKSSNRLLSTSKSLKTLIAENRAQQQEEIHRDSRVAGGKIERIAKSKVIVDTREFRSMLPIQLDQMGMSVIPKQLSVGDYILTNNICVERKALQDLIQSLNSGRLYNQAESMSKRYQVAALLIQFENHQAFHFSDEYSDIGLQLSTAKLVLLTIQFPHLKLFWSRSSGDTAELFEELKRHQQEPDENVIEEVDVNDEEKEKSEKAVKLLMQLPGITESNSVKVMNHVTNMHELVNLSKQEMVKLLGEKNGEKLFEFCNK